MRICSKIQCDKHVTYQNAFTWTTFLLLILYFCFESKTLIHLHTFVIMCGED